MKFNTWDIETENWIDFKVASIYTGEESFILYSIDEVIKKFIKIGGIFYAHYGGGFDNHFIINEINKRKYRLVFKNISGNLSTVSVYYKNSNKKLFELRDSYNILPFALEYLAKELTNKRKLDIDRTKIHEYSKQEIDDYVLSDSVILHEAITNYLKLTGKDKIRLTIASECFAEHKKLFDHKKLRVPAILDSFLRQSYGGARTEVFKRYGEDLKYYDFKSMYPSVMYEKEYPAGYCIFTKEYIDDFFGIYKCNIVAPDLAIPFLHTYNKDGKLIFPQGEFSGTYTSVEIEKAKQLGYIVEVLEGYYFTEKERPFKPYVRKWYGFKQEAENNDNKALRFISKLYLNSLYGKFGQRRIFTKIMHKENTLDYYMEKYGNIKDYDEKLNILLIEEESRSKYTTVHIASFVTAYARIKLYEAFEQVQEKNGTLYYCDTDSLVTDVELDTSKGLGALDLEDELGEAVFLAPKLYAYITHEEKYVNKHKGLREKYELETYKKALLYNDFNDFYEERECFASILERRIKRTDQLLVLQKHRSVKGTFDKRNLLNQIDTKPIKL